LSRQGVSTSNDDNVQRVRNYLQQTDAQKRIRQYMQDVYAKATVTTSSAARIFGFGEQQLRDWEKRGLISTERSTQEGKETRGHRQFTFDELNKLAILKELKDGGFTPGDIPATVDVIWHEVTASEDQQMRVEQGQQEIFLDSELPIIQRINKARDQLSVRFYASHALRLSLMLIGEDMPGYAVGLLLPLRPEVDQLPVKRTQDLHLLGESLLGWAGRSRSTHTLFTHRPSFEYSLDYRIHPLLAMEKDQSIGEVPADNTHVIVRRDAKPLTLTREVVGTINALLKPLYENAELVIDCFGPGMNDLLEASTDLDYTTVYPDLLLDYLANMIIHLGDQINQKQRWRFCCILLPKDPARPLQQRTLVVRAQSQDSPHKVGVASVSPDYDLNSLSLHAYQSGQVCYRHKISPDDSVIAFRDVEHPINSAIALPVGAEHGEPSAVIYVVSELDSAFAREQDRRVLRMMGRMVDEAVRTYQLRRREVENLGNILRSPDIIDDVVGIFNSENDFIRDLEEFLLRYKIDRDLPAQQESTIGGVNQEGGETLSEQHVISLIGIDVDHLSGIALKYGERAVRNLCRVIGQRIEGELSSTFRKYPGCKLYHIYADRFYVLMRDVPYDQAVSKARLLKKSLDGFYKINLVSTLPPAPGTLQEIQLTVRLAVSAYDNATLDALFVSYPNTGGVYSVREMIERSLSTELKKGMDEGGNHVRAWNPATRLYERLMENQD
jgi:DNA-binding transcriptional MerR regulator